MKPWLARRLKGRRYGRPFTGAWIETLIPVSASQMPECRPFTGAWIETCPRANPTSSYRVAPSRGRGLKHTGTAFFPLCRSSPLHGGVD